MGLKLACGFFASFDDMKIADFLSKKRCNCERGSGRWKDWVRGRQAEQLAFQRSISSNDYFTMKGLEGARDWVRDRQVEQLALAPSRAFHCFGSCV